MKNISDIQDSLQYIIFAFNLLNIRKIFVTLHTDYGLGYP